MMAKHKRNAREDGAKRERKSKRRKKLAPESDRGEKRGRQPADRKATEMFRRHLVVLIERHGSRKKLAAFLGTNVKTITAWAAGTRAPQVESLRPFVRQGINLDWLLFGAGSYTQRTRGPLDGGRFVYDRIVKAATSISPTTTAEEIERHLPTPDEVLSVAARLIGEHVHQKELERIGAELLANGGKFAKEVVSRLRFGGLTPEEQLRLLMFVGETRGAGAGYLEWYYRNRENLRMAE